MLLAADDVRGEVGPRQFLCRVKHTQLEAAHESLAQVTVEVALLDESLLKTLGEVHKHLTTLQVGAIENSIHRG